MTVLLLNKQADDHPSYRELVRALGGRYPLRTYDPSRVLDPPLGGRGRQRRARGPRPTSARFGDLVVEMAIEVTPEEKYLFDVQGYLILKGAIDPDYLAQINEALDPWEERAAPELDADLQKSEKRGKISATSTCWTKSRAC